MPNFPVKLIIKQSTRALCRFHKGRKCSSGPENSIDTWSLEKPHDDAQLFVVLVDVEGKKHVIELVNSDELGDTI